MKAAVFKEVLSSGKRLVRGAFVCVYRVSKDTSVGYIASRKVGGAVVRNKCKRRLRALVRDSKLKGIECIFIARKTLSNIPFSTVTKQFKSCIANVYA